MAHFLGDIPPGEVFKTTRATRWRARGTAASRCSADGLSWTRRTGRAAGKADSARAPRWPPVDALATADLCRLDAQAEEAAAAAHRLPPLPSTFWSPAPTRPRSCCPRPGRSRRRRRPRFHAEQAKEHARALRLYEAAFLLTGKSGCLLRLAEMRWRIGHVEVARALYLRLLDDPNCHPNERKEAQEKVAQLAERANRQAERRLELVAQLLGAQGEAKEKETEARGAPKKLSKAAALAPAQEPRRGGFFGGGFGGGAPAAAPSGGPKLQRRPPSARPRRGERPPSQAGPSPEASRAAQAERRRQARRSPQGGAAPPDRNLSFGSKPARAEPPKEPAANGAPKGEPAPFVRNFDTRLPTRCTTSPRWAASPPEWRAKKAMLAASDLEAYVSKMAAPSGAPRPARRAPPSSARTATSRRRPRRRARRPSS